MFNKCTDRWMTGRAVSNNKNSLLKNKTKQKTKTKHHLFLENKFTCAILFYFPLLIIKHKKPQPILMYKYLDIKHNKTLISSVTY